MATPNKVLKEREALREKCTRLTGDTDYRSPALRAWIDARIGYKPPESADPPKREGSKIVVHEPEVRKVTINRILTTK